MKSLSIKDLVAGATLLALAIFLHLVARQIEPRIPSAVDSGFFPEIASGLLAGLALLIVLRALFPRRAVMQAPAHTEDDATDGPVNRASVAATFALILAYGVVIETLGFLVATILYLPLQITLLAARDERRLPAFALVSLIATGLIYAIFAHGFGLILPTGAF